MAGIGLTQFIIMVKELIWLYWSVGTTAFSSLS
jgi:hypothetical protein